MECQHPHFRPADTDMWADHMQNPSSAGKNSLEAADGQIDKLEMDKNKAHFEADALSLARDAAQCAALFQKTQQTERSRRLAKVMHLKQENTVGASIVASYMEKSCKHIGGDRLLPAVDQVGKEHNFIVSSSKQVPPGTKNQNYKVFLSEFIKLMWNDLALKAHYRKSLE